MDLLHLSEKVDKVKLSQCGTTYNNGRVREIHDSNTEKELNQSLKPKCKNHTASVT